MSTLCIVAHPDINNSSSQQYLLQAGKQMTNVRFVDVVREEAAFNFDEMKSLFADSTQIILQFPLYWYQAPSILKEWIDQIFTQLSEEDLAGKYLGITVVIGGKRENYCSGGKVGRTISELLSSYEVLARHFKMIFKPIFTIYQFQFMSEHEKGRMMWHYLYYLENTQTETFSLFQHYLINKAQALGNLDIQISVEQSTIWELFLNQLNTQADEVDELMTLMRNEE